MKTLNERIVDVSLHLQTLGAPEFRSQVQEAVDKKDRNLLLAVCNKAKVPAVYFSAVASVVFSVSPNQKWPEFW